MIFRVIFIILTQCVLGINIVYAADSESQESISELLWMYEEEYIRAHGEADHEKILSFWDESFLGWPQRLNESTGKDGGKEYLTKFFGEPREVSFRIERQGIRIIGNVAILHYRVYLLDGDSSRITHTWIRRDSGWHMLGGMDSPDLSP